MTSDHSKFAGQRIAATGDKVRLVGRVAVISIAALCLSACSAQVANHGHVFSQDEIAQIRPGMSKDQVKLILGTPDTKSSIGGDAFYYISSRHETLAFMPSKVTERRVLAVYFRAVTRLRDTGLKQTVGGPFLGLVAKNIRKNRHLCLSKIA